MSKKITVVDFLEVVKKESSKWVKTQGPMFDGFYWQEGYGAFSIGQSGVAALRRYIANQKKHHQTVSFEEEFLELLRSTKFRMTSDTSGGDRAAKELPPA